MAQKPRFRARQNRRGRQDGEKARRVNQRAADIPMWQKTERQDFTVRETPVSHSRRRYRPQQPQAFSSEPQPPVLPSEDWKNDAYSRYGNAPTPYTGYPDSEVSLSAPEVPPETSPVFRSASDAPPQRKPSSVHRSRLQADASSWSWKNGEPASTAEVTAHKVNHVDVPPVNHNSAPMSRPSALQFSNGADTAKPEGKHRKKNRYRGQIAATAPVFGGSIESVANNTPDALPSAETSKLQFDREEQRQENVQPASYPSRAKAGKHKPEFPPAAFTSSQNSPDAPPPAAESRLQFDREKQRQEYAPPASYLSRAKADKCKPEFPPAAFTSSQNSPDVPPPVSSRLQFDREKQRQENVQPASYPSRAKAGKHKLEFPPAASVSSQNSLDAPPPAVESKLKFTADEKPPEPHPSSHTTEPPGEKPGAADAAVPASDAVPRLQFTDEEKPPEPPGKKLLQAQRKVERVEVRLQAAQGKLPTKRVLRVEKVQDETSGKTTRKLRVEKETKTQAEHLRGPLPLRPVKAGANAAIGYAHKKMYEVEHENVGVKAAHRTEFAAEGGLRTAYRFHKTRPYRRVERLQQKSAAAKANLEYQQTLRDHPELQKKRLARMRQKRNIKRRYAKAARDAHRKTKTLHHAQKAARRNIRTVIVAVRHPAIAGIVLALLLLAAVIMALMSSCSSIASGISSALASSYTAADQDVNNAELLYTEWETALREEIENIESDHPGYDEYIYTIDDIQHDPYALMGWLTAVYGDFELADVEDVLREVFDEQYKLALTEEVQERYRDPSDANGDGNLEPYDYYILHIELTTRPLDEVLEPRMDSDQQEHQDLLVETRGNRQYTYNPFSFDWTAYISCGYGWRIHPITGGKDNHPAVDIAVAAGTEILAAHDGVVQTATWHDSYGNYIALSGEENLVTKYAHCSELLVSAGQTVRQGDVIAKVGSTGNSTGPHLHFEVIKNGEYLNPLFFAGTTGNTNNA